MGKIFDYIINMIPYMIIAIPIIILIRLIIYFKNNKKLNLIREITLFIFLLFIFGLASQTIIPKFEVDLEGNIKIIKSLGGVNLIPFKVLKDTYIEVFINNNINYFIINFLGNIMLFIPIVFFIPLLWNISYKKVILLGFYSSLFIEFCQLFIGRGTDIDDLILNTFGVILGVIFFKVIFRKLEGIIEQIREK